MVTIRIRKGEKRDIETMVSLLDELFTQQEGAENSTEAHRAALSLFLQEPRTRSIFIAEANGFIVGMATAQIVVSTPSGGYSILLENLYVVPSFRRRGVGSKLLERTVAWGFEHGAHRVQLVTAAANTKASLFYRHAGLLKSPLTSFYGKIDVIDPSLI
jgi:GNAT superfamily N-acetyltransferase